MLPEICTTFGCGRKLSLREKLCGNRCSVCIESGGLPIVAFTGRLHRLAPLTEYEQNEYVRQRASLGLPVKYSLVSNIKKIKDHA